MMISDNRTFPKGTYKYSVNIESNLHPKIDMSSRLNSEPISLFWGDLFSSKWRMSLSYL